MECGETTGINLLNYMGDHTPAEMGWSLRFTPRMPQGRGWVVRGFERPLPQWNEYLSTAA